MCVSFYVQTCVSLDMSPDVWYKRVHMYVQLCVHLVYVDCCRVTAEGCCFLLALASGL